MVSHEPRSTRGSARGVTPGPSQQAQLAEDDTPTQPTLAAATQGGGTPTNEEEDLQAELENERRLLRLAEQRALVQRARARRIAIENGEIFPDLEAPAPTQARPAAATLPQPQLFEIQLPKAEPPPKFEGKNRSQLNSWIRGCERYIHGSHALNTLLAQVQFALQYLRDN